MDLGLIDHIQMQEYLYNGTVYIESKQYVIVEKNGSRPEIINPFKAAGIEIADTGITIRPIESEGKKSS